MGSCRSPEELGSLECVLPIMILWSIRAFRVRVRMKDLLAEACCFVPTQVSRARCYHDLTPSLHGTCRQIHLTVVNRCHTIMAFYRQIHLTLQQRMSSELCMVVRFLSSSQQAQRAGLNEQMFRPLHAARTRCPPPPIQSTFSGCTAHLIGSGDFKREQDSRQDHSVACTL